MMKVLETIPNITLDAVYTALAEIYSSTK